MRLDLSPIRKLDFQTYPKYHSRVITIASGKGGVGKTNLAVNLAVILARRNLRVALLDADLGTANVDILLGLQPRYHLHHVITGQKKLSEIIVEGPFGLKVIPGASGLPDLADLPSHDREYLLRNLMVLDGAFDLLLIDTGAGVDSKVVQFIRAAGEVLIVTNPEPTAITDAYALIKVLNGYPSVSIKVIINSVRSRGEGDAAGRKLVAVAEQFLGKQIEILGVLPYDDMVPRAVRTQTPFIQTYPRSPAAVAINNLSEQLWTGKSAAPSKSGGISGFLKRMLFN